ncbi:SDR family oxidoreductase [Pelagibacterium halotolerans]|uniref:NADPH:quinone oxidoreductase 2 n=1 Tax=Pelagibacterium halotolerans (strain DSM 22347 / JCM 15775 / CGMCC 1.7692 / B2) TaxID=1082931 RepID=G4R6N9_PELHB|nr:SDR family oxidoreductase [Pelagibacterium halotolerans]AEQ52201.1 NADPH:quinone oxidoreductase 2 [Pelagibacterium halotolerans B2]QJR18044.1 SDR family oxidoreductase [Pelagibacterium halotolerans]SEA95267.1 NAD(P)H dehydrogenase (quinone) [Pelagibacterium halotolerans]
MYAVTGATGQLGRLVIAALKEKGLGDQTIALVRDLSKGADLGISTRLFDYDEPETLEPALEGVEKLLLISGSEVGRRVPQHKAVIDAAVRAGVNNIIYTSLLHADTSEIVLAPEHRETEAAIKASGIKYTILRNSWYTENYTGNLGAALANGAIIGSAGDGKLNTANRGDLAQAAANVLVSDGHADKIYELGNDRAYTLAELAAEVSRQSGKPVVYTDLPKAEYAKILQGIGLPAPLAEMLADSDAKAGAGAFADDSGTLGKLLGRPTQTLEQAVAEALK